MVFDAISLQQKTSLWASPMGVPGGYATPPAQLAQNSMPFQQQSQTPNASSATSNPLPTASLTTSAEAMARSRARRTAFQLGAIMA
mmetsp:Transcript_46990/g.94084  ORF Transcript_46990/g.94084 Transcript_46990/m.94084 type:complete len:86 (+) Transcript_46990:25-282(+)